MKIKTYSSLREKEQYYTCYTVDSLTDLTSVLDKFEGKRMVFRGLKEAYYYNYPSAIVRGIELSQEKYNELIASSIDAVWSNKRIRKMLMKRSDDCTDMQVLSLLQHYGFGTPLLDFTYKFNYAVFFALDGMSYTPDKYPDHFDINNYISIYLFDINDAEHCSIQEVNQNDIEPLEARHQEAARYIEGYSGLSKQLYNSFKKTPYRELANIDGGITVTCRYGGKMNIVSPLTELFVTYDISNDRNDLQYGVFKLSPSVSLSYEEIALKHLSTMPNHLFCINIHKSLAEDLKAHYLNPFGICTETIYPRTCFYNRIIRELLKIPFYERIVPEEKLVKIKPCTYRKLRRIAKKKEKKMKDNS